jgi:putative endonuclease
VAISNPNFHPLHISILDKINRREIGAEGEDIAEKYLLSHGFLIITKNWGVKIGEIDIIAKSPDGDLVFVEVKYVKTRVYGNAAWKIGRTKLAQIKRVAQWFISEHQLEGETIRVDAIAITGSKIEYYKNCI